MYRWVVTRVTDIIVANGGSLTVHMKGSVHLSSGLSLTSVLHTPGNPFSLLSISWITRDLQCSIRFFPDSCILKDLKTKKTVGRGHVAGGLYMFDINFSLPVPAWH